MTVAADRAALIARARKYPGDLWVWDSEAIAEASRLLADLTAELSNAEIELAVARAIVNESIRGERALQAAAWDEGRNSYGADFRKRLESAQHEPPTVNPYRDTLPAGWVWCIVPARSRYATGNDRGAN